MADERDPVAALVHDLRSPLTVIELYSGLLEREGLSLDAERHADFVDRIRHAVDDMRRLLDDAVS